MAVTETAGHASRGVSISLFGAMACSARIHTIIGKGVANVVQKSAHHYSAMSERPLAKSADKEEISIQRRSVDPNGAPDRLRALGDVSHAVRSRVESFIELSKRGLPRMYAKGLFVHTVRSVGNPAGAAMRLEGDNLRYTTKCALGLACVDAQTQQRILDGDTAADLALLTVARAEGVTDDPGVVALAAWSAAEAANHHANKLFKKLEDIFARNEPLATVDCAWTLIAALAALHLADTRQLAVRAKERLLANQGSSGLFPHMLPSRSSGRLRGHVGSFADQVYSIQGLARYSVAMCDPTALAAADACGARICALQGPAGQWWWHYDARNGGVVEGYPVYSVHQHGMGPMALLDLRDAGGRDHLRSVIRGLEWIERHPEVSGSMVDDRENVIWRKAGRREPKKATRAISALTTAIHPGMKLPGLDAIFPPNRLDYECRPYELGWLLYAWLGGGIVQRLRPAGTSGKAG